MVEQIKNNVHPVKVDLPGSGENDSEGRFLTYIGSDTVQALKEYFQEQRGWPERGEPIWTYPENNQAVNKPAFEAVGSKAPDCALVDFRGR